MVGWISLQLSSIEETQKQFGSYCLYYTSLSYIDLLSLEIVNWVEKDEDGRPHQYNQGRWG